MVNSMTGFGKGSSEEEGLRIESIIKTTNHKYLSLKLEGIGNKELEKKTEEILKDNFSRGRVELEVKVEGRGPGAENLPSPDQVKESYKYLERIASELNLPEDPGISDLVGFGAFDSAELEKELWDPLKKSLQEAIAEVREDKRKEGEALSVGLRDNLDEIEDLAYRIRSGISEVVESYRSRLEEKVEEFLDCEEEEDKKKLGREVALFADKVDIEEEIDRIFTHVENARSTLDSDKASGKKLDFIAQELKREANTVSAKCKDGNLQEMAVDMKLEIEKFTEQVRNIE